MTIQLATWEAEKVHVLNGKMFIISKVPGALSAPNVSNLSPHEHQIAQLLGTIEP